MGGQVQRMKKPHYEADDYCEVWLAEEGAEAAPKHHFTEWLPGLAIAIVAGLAASSLAGTYGLPSVLAGLLIGFALNFIGSSERVRPGLEFCSSTLLRLGIVLLGARITFAQFAELGIVSLAALVAIMATVIASAVIAARLSGQGNMVGLLAGGATAICGASAALAIYATIGRDRLDYSRFTFTLVGITVASALALMSYPILAHALDFTDRQAGFLMGAAIHDVAQALGAAYGYSKEAGETGSIVKLTRVAMLAPVVALIGLAIARPLDRAGASYGWRKMFRLPWFITAFFAFVLANSLFDFPQLVADWSLFASQNLLLLAIIGAAMRSRLDRLLHEGWRGLIPVVAATLVSFIASAAYAAYLL